MVTDATAACLQSNPYVGPRPIETGEPFLAREREARGLTQRILSARVVLLHSPSGAGKTSLIQAAVLPAFDDLGFQVCVGPGKTFVPLRVNAQPPEGLSVTNRYVYGGVLAMLGHLHDPADLAQLSLAQAFDRLRAGSDAPKDQLIVFDQLEEVLTLNPTDRDGQEEFFRQLGIALEDSQRWALLSMREDFMGGLDRFLKQIPGRLRSTYRLDFMEEDAARQAICGPAEKRGVQVEKEATNQLIGDLRRVKVEGPDHRTEQILGLYVEPMLLQVACHNLWRKRCKTTQGNFTAITLDDVVSSGRVEKALRRYYDDVVAEAALSDLSSERALRDWIGTGLITDDEHRSQMGVGPAIPQQEEVLQLLKERYLVRDYVRDGTRWWELSHDRLIEAVLHGNAAWRHKRLEHWQIEALKWDRGGREDDSYLLDKEACRTARRSLAKLGVHATDVERRFVARSEGALAQDNRLKAIALRFSAMLLLLVVSAAINVILFVLWLLR